MTDLDLIRFGLRPTLIIGLGGTGHEVLVRLKTRYLDAYGEDIFRIIKLLSFDTAEESKDAIRENGASVQLDKSTELIHIGNVPTTRILKNINLNPTIKNWLPADIPPRAITAGAMMVRSMGRLALFHHFSPKIQPVLEQAIRALSNVRERGEIGEQGIIARTQGLNIFIITSLCGGTGSGIYLDMAYLLRQLCMNQGLDENYCYINGVLVLPQAFASVSSDAIKANAHAALLELDYFTKNGKFSVEYPGGTIATSQVRPFNLCYLVDGVNERGKMLAGMNELAPMIAEAVFLHTASQVGDAQKSVFDNVKALHGLDQDYPTAYSGLGTASLVFPVETIIDACATRYCATMLQSALVNRPVSPDLVNTEVNAVSEKVYLSEDFLHREMSRGPQGQAMRIHLDERILDQVPHSEMIKVSISKVQHLEDATLNTLFQQQLTNNLDHLQEEMSETLNHEINRIVNDPALGLNLAIALLKALDSYILDLTQTITKKRFSIDKTARQQDIGNLARQKAMEDAALSFVIGRKKRIKKACQVYFSHHKNRLSNLLHKNILSQCLSLLAYLSHDVIRTRQHELENLNDKLALAHDRFKRQAQQLADGKSRALNPLTFEITNGDDVDYYYQQYTRDLNQELSRLFEEYGALHTWPKRSYDEVYTTLLNFGQSIFNPIYQVNIEQVIMHKRDTESHEIRLEKLREDSTPFWNRDITRMADGGSFIETLTVIGVPDSAATIYNHPKEGETLASTHNKHSITVLTTRHGLSVYALQQFDEYKRRYERHLERQVSPLHCFDLLATKQMKTMFALGQAFGYIYNRRNHFYVKFPAEHEQFEEEIELGTGLHNALNRFLAFQDYTQQLQSVVDKYLTLNGEEKGQQLIESYLNQDHAASSSLRSLEKELKKLAFHYKNEYLTQ